MGTLTAAGYTQDTPVQIKTDLENQALAEVVGYSLIPSELRENIIQESVIVEMKMQDGVNSLMNGISPDFSNDFMFKQLGSSFGIYPKDAERGQVTLTFSGTAGTIIPIGTRAKNTTNLTTVQTLVRGIIGSTGSIGLLAESISAYIIPIPATTITVMVDSITGVTVTNASAGTAGLAAQTIEEYKPTVYNEIQSARFGGITRAYSLLEKITGVQRRLIFFRPLELILSAKYYQGIEAVIGGGDDYEVAAALFESFLQTKNLLSSPSNAETARTVSKTITLYNSTFPIKFTRPKLITAIMGLNISIVGTSTTKELLEGLLKPVFESYFNTANVGTAVSKAALDDATYTSLKTAGIFPYNISALTYTFSLGGVPVSFVGNLLPVEFDQYITLGTFTVILT